MNQRDEFGSLLLALAEACEYNLPEKLVHIYDLEARKMGYERVNLALTRIIINRRSRDPFPTIKEIRDIIEPQLSGEDAARDSAARIVKAVGKFGRTNMAGAKDYIGELGWAAVEASGGWSHLCTNLTSFNMVQMTAQLRDLSISLFRKAELGLLDQAPALPAPKNQIEGRLKSLTGKIGRDIT